MVEDRSDPDMNDRDFSFFFIVGAPRSGTTLLSSMLNAHSQIAIPYESNFMVDCYNKYGLRADLNDDQERERLLDEILSGYFVSRWNPKVTKSDLNLDQCKTLPSLIQELYSCYAKKRGKSIWGDKTPGYTPHIHILNKIFPDAKYIHIIRDGRDVALSLVSKSWGPSNFPAAIKLWRETVSLCEVQLSMLPHDRYLTLKFEDLVKSTRECLLKICNLLAINYEEQISSTYPDKIDYVPNSVRSIHENLKELPSETQCYKWKKSMCKSDQAIAYEIAGDILTKFEYPTPIKNSILKIPRHTYHKIVESVSWRFSFLSR